MKLKTISKIISFVTTVPVIVFVLILDYYKISIISEQFWVLLSLFVGYGFLKFIDGVIRGEAYDGR